MHILVGLARSWLYLFLSRELPRFSIAVSLLKVLFFIAPKNSNVCLLGQFSSSSKAPDHSWINVNSASEFRTSQKDFIASSQCTVTSSGPKSSCSAKRFIEILRR